MLVYMFLIQGRACDIQIIKDFSGITAIREKSADHICHNRLAESAGSGEADIIFGGPYSWDDLCKPLCMQ